MADTAAESRFEVPGSGDTDSFTEAGFKVLSNFFKILGLTIMITLSGSAEKLAAQDKDHIASSLQADQTACHPDYPAYDLPSFSLIQVQTFVVKCLRRMLTVL